MAQKLGIRGVVEPVWLFDQFFLWAEMAWLWQHQNIIVNVKQLLHATVLFINQDVFKIIIQKIDYRLIDKTLRADDDSVTKSPVQRRVRPSRRAFGQNRPSNARISIILPVFLWFSARSER